VAVAITGSGAVVADTLAGTNLAWASVDGVTWQDLAGSVLPAGFKAQSVTATADALLIGGSLGSGNATEPVIYRSTDGTHWGASRLSAGYGVSRFSSARKGVVVSIGSAVLVPGAERWLRSADGTTWVDDPSYGPLGVLMTGEGAGSYPAGRIDGDGERLIAVNDAGTTLWTSADAATWTKVAQSGGSHPNYRLLAFGLVATDNDGSVWLGVPATAP